MRQVVHISVAENRSGKGHTFVEIRSGSGVQTLSKHSLLRTEKKGRTKRSTAHFWTNPLADIMQPRVCVLARLTSEWVTFKCRPEERQRMCNLLTTIRVGVDRAVVTDHCAFPFGILRMNSHNEKDEWMIVCNLFIFFWFCFGSMCGLDYGLHYHSISHQRRVKPLMHQTEEYRFGWFTFSTDFSVHVRVFISAPFYWLTKMMTKSSTESFCIVRSKHLYPLQFYWIFNQKPNPKLHLDAIYCS